MGVMLDTSALIGLHEADPEVATYLAVVLEQHDDGTVPKTHQAVLGTSAGEVHGVDRRRAGEGTNHSEVTDQLLDARPAEQPLEFARRGHLGSWDHTAGRDPIQTAV